MVLGRPTAWPDGSLASVHVNAAPPRRAVTNGAATDASQAAFSGLVRRWMACRWPTRSLPSQWPQLCDLAIHCPTVCPPADRSASGTLDPGGRLGAALGRLDVTVVGAAHPH